MTPAPPSNRRARWPFGVLIALVALVGAVLVAANGGLGRGSASPGPSSSVPGVVPADAAVVAEGRAEPVVRAELVAEAGGRITALPVAEGATVAKGQVLVQLDDVAAGFEVQSAQAAADAATAATARATASVDQAKVNVTAAVAAVAQAQASRRAALAARDQVPSGASRAVKRQADAQIDQADAALDSANAQLSGARAAVRIAQAALAGAKADEARAGVAVSSAEAARSRLAVTSPIAGTVVSVEPAVGDLVQPGVVVARVADLSRWQFETSDLSETSVARVRVGAAATVTLDGLPGVEIPATVASVSGFGVSSQGDIVFRVVVTPTGEVPAGVRWNMTATIEIVGVAAAG
jgi:HlyD family secretion protein